MNYYGVGVKFGGTQEMLPLYLENDCWFMGFRREEKPSFYETAQKVQPGDVMIALPSSGVHSNGFSLVRKVFELESKPRNIFREFNGSTLGETLLTPTRLYVKPMLKLMDEIKVKSVVHVTGGGFYENIPRALNDRTKAVVERNSVRVLPIFQEIQKVGEISEHDMFNTFNMGVGMVLTVPAEQADKALEILHANGEPEAYRLGVIAEGEGVELC